MHHPPISRDHATHAQRLLSPWLALFAAVIAAQMVLELLGQENWRLVVDRSELIWNNVPVRRTDGALTIFGGLLLLGGAAASWVAGTLRHDRWRAPLLALSAQSMLLAADDLLLLHERAARALDVSGSWFLLIHVAVAIALLRRFGRTLMPLWPLALLGALSFGASFAFEVAVEDVLGLRLAGQTFVEENLKILGIVALSGLNVIAAASLLRPGGRLDVGLVSGVVDVADASTDDVVIDLTDDVVIDLTGAASAQGDRHDADARDAHAHQLHLS